MTTRRLLVALVAVLAVYDVVRHTSIPGSISPWTSVATIGVVAGVALAARMTAVELGTARADLGRGLAWGGAAFGAIAVVLAVAAAVPAWRGLFDDDRAEVSVAAMLWRAIVVIPIATVVFEELAFRGVMLGLLRRLTTDRPAVAAGAVLFGLWHVPGVIDDGIGAIAGTVAATTVAGVVFAWLRLASRSLLAPVLAHTATNSVALALAWLLAR